MPYFEGHVNDYWVTNQLSGKLHDAISSCAVVWSYELIICFFYMLGISFQLNTVHCFDQDKSWLYMDKGMFCWLFCWHTYTPFVKIYLLTRYIPYVFPCRRNFFLPVGGRMLKWNHFNFDNQRFTSSWGSQSHCITFFGNIISIQCIWGCNLDMNR